MLRSSIALQDDCHPGQRRRRGGGFRVAILSVAPMATATVHAPLAIPTDVQLRSTVAPEDNRYIAHLRVHPVHVGVVLLGRP